MGIYVITGGNKGIGEQTAEILRAQGNEVLTTGSTGGDIIADIGTARGREEILTQVRSRCPGGLDGLVCNAGIAGIPAHKPSYILSVNYFGAVAVANGLYGLLKKKKGKCAVTTSASIAWFSYAERGKYYVDQLLNNCGDEERIGRLADTFDVNEAGTALYVSAKFALARWVRRVSPSWAASGVNINAVAPGPVDTAILKGVMDAKAGPGNLPMPALYGQNRIMDPAEVAHTLAYLVSPGMVGLNGSVLFCDSGTTTIFDTERYS